MRTLIRVGFIIALISAWAGGIQNVAAQQLQSVTESDLASRAGMAKRYPGAILAVNASTIVARFENRIEFIPLPPSVTFDPGTGFLKRGTETLRPIHFTPSAILKFDYPFDVLRGGDNLLICSNLAHPRIQNSWAGDFCGVISIEGDMVYRFPVSQRPPDRVLRVIAISGDGTYAEVFLGKVESGEDGPDVGAPREIFAWRHPDGLKRIAGPWKDGVPEEPAKAFAELIHGFGKREQESR